MGRWPLYVGLVLIVTGLMAAGAAALNLDVFMDSPKAEPFVRSLGRTGARVFYIVLGAVFVALGIFFLNTRL